MRIKPFWWFLAIQDSVRILRSALRPAPLAQLSFLMQCLQMERTLGPFQYRCCAELAIVSKAEPGKQRPAKPKEKLFLWGEERFSPFVAKSGSLDK